MATPALRRHCRAFVADGVTVGGVPALVSSVGLEPASLSNILQSAVGYAQAVVHIPELAAGSYPLVITVNGRPSASVTVYVGGTLTSQTIAFGPLSDQTLGSPVPPLSAIASSGFAVTFVSATPAVCMVSGGNVAGRHGQLFDHGKPGRQFRMGGRGPDHSDVHRILAAQTIRFGPMSNQIVLVRRCLRSVRPPVPDCW